LHAVSVGKTSARVSNFWTVRIFYIQIQTEFRISAHPYYITPALSPGTQSPRFLQHTSAAQANDASSLVSEQILNSSEYFHDYTDNH